MDIAKSTAEGISSEDTTTSGHSESTVSTGDTTASSHPGGVVSAQDTTASGHSVSAVSAEGFASVDRAIVAFCARHGIDRRDYLAKRNPVFLGPFKFPFPNPGYLPFHDLHHLALDAPPRFWGEVEVSALELRSGCPTWLIWFLCMAAMILGSLVAPRRVWRAWRRYRRCTNVYLGHSYQDLLALDMAALRRLLNLPEPTTLRGEDSRLREGHST